MDLALRHADRDVVDDLAAAVRLGQAADVDDVAHRAASRSA